MNAFEFDLFISYAHLDNRSEWIDTLHEELKKWGATLLAEEPRIWRDRKLDGIDYFDEQIEEHLRKTAILVAVMSPPYMNSEWCRKELKEFLETTRAQGLPRIGNKARVVKVIKNPIDREDHPPELQNVLGYEFFRVIDQASGKTRELNKIFGPEDEQLFYAKLYDLVTDLVEPLKLIREQRDDAVAPATTATPSGKTVYLAETTYDLHPQRDQIRRELEMNGHRVLPDRPLSHRGPELLTQVQDCLERCTLSIHLVGEQYSLVPEAAERSVIELQNALAAERSAAAGLTRVIWLPDGLQAQGEKQQALVQALRDDPAGAELLETPLEDLKTFIQDKLRPQPQAAAPEALPDDRPPLLYLLFSQPDQDDIWPLDDFLYDQGFETKQALFDGNGDLDQDYHQAMLNECDAVLIYYGRAQRKWVELTLNNLARAPGMSRKATALYVALPEEAHKARFRTRAVDEVIKHFDDFDEEALAPFLRVFEAKRGGTGA